MGVKRENIKQFFNLAIPSNWEIISIGYLCTIYVGRDLKESSYSKNKSDEFRYPVYSNTVEKEGLYGYYNYKEFTGDSLTIVGRGAGLGTAFTRRGSYGAIGRLLVLFPNENVSAHYITEYVNNKINIHQESGGIPQLTGQQIARYKISIPKYSEQKTIAKALGLMDKAIISNNKLIAQKELRKKWLMQNLLSGKKRLKGFENEKWKSKSLEEIANFRNGKGHEKFIDQRGKYIVVNSKFISTEGQTSKRSDKNLSPLMKNEIAMVMSDIPNGKALAKCFFVEQDDKYTLNQRICGVEAKEKTSSLFLYFILNRNQHYLSFNNGVSQTNLKKEEVIECPLFVPSIEEQTAIAQILMATDKELNLLKVKTEKLKEQKKGMMQVLLTGEKRLNLDLED